jgi:hypothetical protein
LTGSEPGETNIFFEPQFINPSVGDFRLCSTSDCIDAGTSEGAPDDDIRGFHRPYGSWIDMGAYEYSNVSPPIEIPLAIIGILDGKDLYDLNGDGIIDAADLLVY